MGLYINTNVSSLIAQKNFGRTQSAMNQSMLRLSTGMRINRAADDAAGLAISEGLKAEIRSMGQAKRNANDAISMLQTGEGAIEQMQTNFIRMRELAVQSANGTLNSQQRSAVDGEFQALKKEHDRIAMTTEFSGMKMLNGDLGQVSYQIGIDGDPNSRISMKFDDARLAAMSMGGMNVDSVSDARQAMNYLDGVMGGFSGARAEFGAVHNQLTSAIANLETGIENLSAANSRIREVDFAEETAELTRTQILMQAGVAVLAQANISPQYALSLLG